MTPLLSPNFEANRINCSEEGNEDATTSIRPAQYVKVIDLATLNKLDVGRLKQETLNKMKEMEYTDAGVATAGGFKDDSSKATSQDDVSFQSSDGPKGKENRYQKPIIPKAGGFNLCLLVGNVKIVVEKTRVDKSQVRLAECEVGDETGIASLRARDEQIPLLQEISNRKGAVVLRNCSIELFQGKFIRLAVSKWGKVASFPDGISSTPTPPSNLNDSLHLSVVDVSSLIGDEWLESSSHSTSRHSTGRGNRDHGSSSDHTFRNRNQSLNNANKKRIGSGPGGYDRQREAYNPNQMHSRGSGGHGQMNPNQNMLPGINSYYPQQMYPGNIGMHPYNFGYGQAPMHQMQYYDQQKQHEDYMRHQDYALQMQMQSMGMSYQHQQHQDRSAAFGSPRLPPGQSAHREEQHSGDSPAQQFSVGMVSNGSPSTAPSSTATALRNDTLSPPQFGLSGDNESWSMMRLDAESPMMNPHAPVFTSSYHMPMPNLTLPAQHYYTQQTTTQHSFSTMYAPSLPSGRSMKQQTNETPPSSFSGSQGPSSSPSQNDPENNDHKSGGTNS